MQISHASFIGSAPALADSIRQETLVLSSKITERFSVQGAIESLRGQTPRDYLRNGSLLTRTQAVIELLRAKESRPTVTPPPPEEEVTPVPGVEEGDEPMVLPDEDEPLIGKKVVLVAGGVLLVAGALAFGGPVCGAVVLRFAPAVGPFLKYYLYSYFV